VINIEQGRTRFGLTTMPLLSMQVPGCHEGSWDVTGTPEGANDGSIVGALLEGVLDGMKLGSTVEGANVGNEAVGLHEGETDGISVGVEYVGCGEGGKVEGEFEGDITG